jgi:hypothetical protein
LHAFADEQLPLRNPESAITPDASGWGALPRITQPRFIIFTPEQPVPVQPGTKIRFVIHHDEGPGDFAALVMNRFRLRASGNNDWTRWTASPEFAARRDELQKMKQARQAIPAAPMPVMVESDPLQRRVTSLFVRGNWLDKGPEIGPGVPHVFAFMGGEPVSNRLDFARWLVHPKNPLTARVLVNRVWEQLFGVGLVETVEDFGSSGEAPSNQALLDHLALAFQNEWRWDMKRLLREMTLSATYLQSSQATREQIEKDPRNRFLARGPRTRLTAEMVRDQALAVSGLLSTNRYGPPVMPPQPDGIWRVVYSGEKWVTATNENRFRRAVYTYIRRTAGYPSYQIFDAPSRDICTARRLRTNTPLQALVTLNDPVYLECATALAKLTTADAPDVPARLRDMFERVTGQPPSPADLQDLELLHSSLLAHYGSNPPEAQKLGGTAELAALTVAASVILNLDASLTR